MRDDESLSDALNMYFEYSRSYYNGTRHAGNIRSGLLRYFAGFERLPLGELGTPVMAQIRDLRAREGTLSRSYINKLIGYARQFALWAAEYGHAPGSLVGEIQAVRKLRRGAHGAGETDRVEPANPEHVELVRRSVGPVVASYIEMLLYTGMRPGEARVMRAGDLELVATDAYVYTPMSHKTAHHGKARYIAIVGPAFDLANRLIYQLRSSSLYQDAEYLFSPDGDGRRPYAEYSIAQVIRQRCDRLGIERWSPNQIRHLVATEHHSRGHETSEISTVLGHASTRTTGVYIHEQKSKVVAAAVRLAI